MKPKSDKPYFSLIIPVAPDRGAEVLDSIRRLDFPKSQYEVIVERGTNPSRNRNNGAKKAKGEILCFLDDDAIVPKGLLTNAEKYFKLFEYHKLAKDYPHNNIDILGGPQLTPPDDKWFAQACGEVLASPFGTLGMSNRYKRGKLNLNAGENDLTSANMFVRADAFKKIGGFNEKLYPGEDPEFLARAKKKGFRIAYSPDLIVYHRRRATLMGFIQQFFSYGYVRLKKEKICKTKARPTFYIPMLFALYVCSLPFISMFSNLVFVPLLIYFVLAMGFSIRDKPYTLLLPILFFVLHFFYGLGMMEYKAERWF